MAQAGTTGGGASLALNRSNFRALYQELAWWGIAQGIRGGFLVVLALRLGATAEQIGLITAVPSAVTTCTLLLVARWVDRQPDLMRLLVVTYVITYGIEFAGIVLAPFLPTGVNVWAIFAIEVIASIPGTVLSVAYTVMLAEVIPRADRPTVIARRNLLMNVTNGVTSLVAGVGLEQIIFPLNYQVAFLVAGVAALMSALSVRRIRLPRQPALAARGLPPSLAPQLRDHPLFLWFTGGSAVFLLGLQLVLPLLPIFWVRELGARESEIGILTGAVSVSMALGYYGWGRIAHGRGSLPVLAIAALGFAAYPALTALTRSVLAVLVPVVIGNLCRAGQSLTMTSGLLDVSPERDRAQFLAIHSTVQYVALFVGPLIGTTLTTIAGVRLALLCGSALCAAGGLIYQYTARAEARLRQSSGLASVR